MKINYHFNKKKMEKIKLTEIKRIEEVLYLVEEKSTFINRI